jgi:1,4-dihydroxy-2-naphthoate octaprenyltransferase
MPLCCFQFVMLLAVNFPDAAGDARVNKRTLVVIFGPQRAAQLFLIVLVAAYLLLPILVLFSLPLPVALAVLLTAPLAFWQSGRIRRGAAIDPAQWDALAFWSIGLLMAAALLEIGAFVIVWAN